jgi:hypothetical protein
MKSNFFAKSVSDGTREHASIGVCPRAPPRPLGSATVPMRDPVADRNSPPAHMPRVTHSWPLRSMSFTLNGQQYNSAFQPKRLGNWEVPALREREPATRPPGHRTVTIVDDNGHLLPGMPKRMTSFSTGCEAGSAKRWPSSPLPPFTGVATMGYKGIQTDYLPTNTVYIRNNPDTVRADACHANPPLTLSRVPRIVGAAARQGDGSMGIHAVWAGMDGLTVPLSPPSPRPPPPPSHPFIAPMAG